MGARQNRALRLAAQHVVARRRVKPERRIGLATRDTFSRTGPANPAMFAESQSDSLSSASGGTDPAGSGARHAVSSILPREYSGGTGGCQPKHPRMIAVGKRLP
jgi:hypothetical protein